MPTFCLPVGGGVPWAGGPPDWWNPADAAAPYNPSTDDPHWRGAFERTNGSGGGTQAFFRGINGTAGGTTNLYLSWVVLLNMPIVPGTTQLWVALSAGPGSDALRLELGPPNASGSQASATYDRSVSGLKAGTSNWIQSIPTPTWLATQTRAWTNPKVSANAPMQSALAWAFELVVPLGTNLDPTNTVNVTLAPGTPFKLWYSMILKLDPNLPNGAVEINFPSSVYSVNVENSPDVTQWADYRPAATPADPGCSATGITIQYGDIGTNDDDGSATGAPRFTAGTRDQYEIKLDLSDPTPNANPPNHDNHFFASPEFPAGTPDPEKAAVTARFRLADWGTTIGTPTTLSWTDLPGGDAVPYDTAAGQCHFLWPTNADLGNPLTQQLLSDFRSGAKEPHQCMLVELSSTFGTETFLQDSVYANMHVVGASRVTREAVVDVRGLAPLGLEPRDVVLWVQTNNMPATIELGGNGGDGGPQIDERLAAVQGGDGQAAGGGDGQGDGQAMGGTVDQLAQTLPTFTVQPFYDTGLRTTRFGDGPQPIWRPMTSFGFFAIHEEGSPITPLTGWASQLQGAKRLADNLYLLEVPNGGTAKITTVVQALEPGETADPLPPIEPWPGPKPVVFPVILETLDTVEDIIEAAVSKVLPQPIANVLDQVEDQLGDRFKSILFGAEPPPGH